jgi:hypothetical protein
MGNNSTVSGSTTTTNSGSTFLVGVMLGFILCAIFTLATLFDRIMIIESYKRIEPEKRLTTDGKVVDTLFIYKQER